MSLEEFCITVFFTLFLENLLKKSSAATIQVNIYRSPFISSGATKVEEKWNSFVMNGKNKSGKSMMMYGHHLNKSHKMS